MFSTQNMSAGFQVTFGNGACVSVQWHGGNYCANRNEPFDTDKPCESAEVAVWDSLTDGEPWLTRKVYARLFGVTLNDDVEGWQSAEDVARILGYVAALSRAEVEAHQ